MQKIHLPSGHYDTGFPQLGHIPGPPASVNYVPPSSAVMSPFCATGLSQGTRDAAYMHWPTASMMYAHSYEQFRQGVLQVNCCYFVYNTFVEVKLSCASLISEICSHLPEFILFCLHYSTVCLRHQPISSL